MSKKGDFLMNNIVKAKKRNKILATILSILLIAIVSGVLYIGILFSKDYGVKPEIEARADNVILLIGDGMGFNHVEVASYFDTPVMTTIEHSGEVTTSALILSPTDSAAAGTALATGRKVFNTNVSNFMGIDLENLGDLTIKNNKKLGIVTTKSVTDATPAAFSAHNFLRINHKSIALEQIRKTDIDVLFGLGREYFEPYANEINRADRAYITNFDDLLINSKEKAYAIFDDPIPTEGDFSLTTLTAIALDMLENENGFFLMVEGAKIDTASHANNMDGMLKEFWDFDGAVAIALAFAAVNPNTTVIVTADHETGELTLPDEPLSEQNINDNLYKSGGHTSWNVPYWAYGPGADEIPSLIDNTDIFYIIKQLLSY